MISTTLASPTQGPAASGKSNNPICDRTTRAGGPVFLLGGRALQIVRCGNVVPTISDPPPPTRSKQNVNLETSSFCLLLYIFFCRVPNRGTTAEKKKIDKFTLPFEPCNRGECVPPFSMFNKYFLPKSISSIFLSVYVSLFHNPDTKNIYGYELNKLTNSSPTIQV